MSVAKLSSITIHCFKYWVYTDPYYLFANLQVDSVIHEVKLVLSDSPSRFYPQCTRHLCIGNVSLNKLILNKKHPLNYLSILTFIINIVFFLWFII